MLDWEALAKKHNTDPTTLDPDVHERTERANAELIAKRARGHIAPESTVAQQRTPIGLDDNYHPFPLRHNPEHNQTNG